MSFNAWLRHLRSTLRAPQPTDRGGRATPGRPRVRLGVESLEDRSLPSAASASLAGVLPPNAGAVAQQQLPFKERLTVVAVSDTGVISYEGQATHLGHVTAVLNPDNSFTKTAANGDIASGYVTHTSDTTGTITLTSGTGRFQGATGTSEYVISADPNTGAVSVAVAGTISYRPAGQAGGSAGLPSK